MSTYIKKLRRVNGQDAASGKAQPPYVDHFPTVKTMGFPHLSVPQGNPSTKIGLNLLASKRLRLCPNGQEMGR